MSRTVFKSMMRHTPLILKEDKPNMQKTLHGIPRNPKAQRSGRALFKRGEENNNGDKNKRQIPNNVQNQNGHRVGATFPNKGSPIVVVVVVNVFRVRTIGEKGAAMAVGGNQTGSVAS